MQPTNVDENTTSGRGGLRRANKHFLRAIIAAAVIALPAAGALAPSAGAATAGQTVTVAAKSATVDNRSPGRYVFGTVFRGNHFKIDATRRVTHGSAKGLWYHGTATVTDEHASNPANKSFKITGWVKAAAFS